MPPNHLRNRSYPATRCNYAGSQQGLDTTKLQHLNYIQSWFGATLKLEPAEPATVPKVKQFTAASANNYNEILMINWLEFSAVEIEPDDENNQKSETTSGGCREC